MKNNYLASAEPELKDLFQKVITKYKDNGKCLEKKLKWYSEAYPRFKGYYSKVLDAILKNNKIEQVVALSNGGLMLGAMAKSLDYDVRILDVHRPENFQEHERQGEICWYYITHKFKMSNGGKFYNPLDPSTIVRCKKPRKRETTLGVIDFDSIEKGQRTAIVDADLDLGWSMGIAYKRALDLGADVASKIVISNHPQAPEIIELSKLI